MAEEHSIPRSINGPERQWLPVCKPSNARSNSIFDNDARDILYWVRYINTGALKRYGEALLNDGSVKEFKFSYYEYIELKENNAFRYIYDREANSHVPCENVYAIKFTVGLKQDDQVRFCRGVAKMSLGALAYLLKNNVSHEELISEIFSQESVEAIRHFEVDLQWAGKMQAMKFSLGISDI